MGKNGHEGVRAGNDRGKTIVSRYENIFVIPLPIIRYGKYHVFGLFLWRRGWRYLRIAVYFRIRKEAINGKRIIFDIMHDWQPFGKIKQEWRMKDRYKTSTGSE